VNDYPSGMSREKANDSDRVYPGDGSAPIVTLLRDLQFIGYRGVLSLELFNRDYWNQDALTVARTGREKIQALVQRAAAT
jgi:sugar phosphate isomerase/epimerase